MSSQPERSDSLGPHSPPAQPSNMTNDEEEESAPPRKRKRNGEGGPTGAAAPADVGTHARQDSPAGEDMPHGADSPARGESPVLEDTASAEGTVPGPQIPLLSGEAGSQTAEITVSGRLLRGHSNPDSSAQDASTAGEEAERESRGVV